MSLHVIAVLISQKAAAAARKEEKKRLQELFRLRSLKRELADSEATLKSRADARAAKVSCVRVYV